MQDIVSAAKAQLAGVEARAQAVAQELEQLRIKRVRLLNFIDLYHELSGDQESVTIAIGDVAEHADSGSVNVVVHPETIKARAIRGAEELLRAGQPKTSKQLVEGLAAIGVVIGGQDPAANLAAILSRQRHRFRNEKGLGYFLVAQKTEPDDALTSSGSVWNSSFVP